MSTSGIDPDQDPLHSRYRIEELERIRWEEEKKQKKGSYQEPPKDEDPGLGGFLALLVEKTLERFKNALKNGLFASTKDPIRDTLLLLKESFEMMMHVDMSQDVLFLRRLSKLWQEALEESIEQEHAPDLAMALKTLIRDIEIHPAGEEHTFGYYLTEYAGQKWLPFPYMELIRKLHHDHALDPPASLLTRWTSLIEEILNRC